MLKAGVEYLVAVQIASSISHLPIVYRRCYHDPIGTVEHREFF
jgi:hypothetical protein